MASKHWLAVTAALAVAPPAGAQPIDAGVPPVAPATPPALPATPVIEPTPPVEPTPPPATTVTTAATPAPPLPSTTAHSRPAPEPFKFMAGFEVGYAWTADPDQLYGNGFGRVFVLGAQSWELRFLEDYDLDDKSGMFDAAEGHGTLGISSLGRRFMFSFGPVSVRPLVGVAWIRRPSLRYDENATFGSFEHDVISQHGLAVMAGGGLGFRLGYLDLAVDARAYPTKWFEIGGDRAVVRNDQLVYEPILESPGGLPYTLTAQLSVGF